MDAQNATSRLWAYPRIHSMATLRERCRRQSICRSHRAAGGPCKEWCISCGLPGTRSTYVHAVRDLVQRADQRLPLSQVKSQSAWIDQAINQEIAFARLC